MSINLFIGCDQTFLTILKTQKNLTMSMPKYLFAALAFIGFNNATLFNADNLLSFYILAHNQLFEYAHDEESSVALRCTCTMLDAEGERYRTQQTNLFNAKLADAQWISLHNDEKKDADFVGLYTPTIRILGGGKKYETLKYYVMTERKFSEKKLFDINTILDGKFTDISLDGKKYYINDRISDPLRKYNISFQHDQHKNNLLCVNTHRGKIALFNMYNHKITLKNNTYTMFDKGTSRIDEKTYSIDCKCLPNNLLYFTVHINKCLLAEKIICYDALKSTDARHEYVFDCCIITELYSTNKSKEKMPIIEAKREQVTTHYRLKKDSLLHDMRAQKALYTVLSEDQNEKFLREIFDEEKFIAFYIASVLWVNPDNYIAKQSLATLFAKELDANIEKMRVDHFEYSAIIRKVVYNFLHIGLHTLLQNMKKQNVTTYEAYVDAINNFVTSECKEQGWIASS